MFMASLFQKLHDELAKYGLEERSKRSRLWFTDRVKSLTGRINRNVLLRDEALKIKKTPMWGYMYMFVYIFTFICIYAYAYICVYMCAHACICTLSHSSA